MGRSLREALEARGITVYVAREAFANYAEGVNETKQRLDRLERETAWWLAVVEALEDR